MDALQNFIDLPILLAKISLKGDLLCSTSVFKKEFADIIKSHNSILPFFDNPSELEKYAAKHQPFSLSYITQPQEGRSVCYRMHFMPEVCSNQLAYIVSIFDETELLREKSIKNIILNISKFELQSNDLKSFFTAIQQELGKLFEADNMFIVLWDKMRRSLKLTYFQDHFDNFKSLPHGKTLSSYVIEMGASLLINESDIYKMNSEGLIDIIGQPSKTWMGAPLVLNGEVLGLMAVQSYKSLNAYTPEDLTLLEYVASQVAISIKRKEHEAFLKISRQKAIESDKLKSAFLANMSHEIRTPMNSIVGFSDLMMRDSIPAKKKETYAKYVSNSSKALLALIDDIIDFAKIEAGQLSIFKAAIPVNATIQELFEYFQSELVREDKENIKLKTNCASNSPNFFILSDEVRLRQLLNNLISNAIKFTAVGSIEFGYLIPNNATIIFYVKDTGIGIPSEKVELVFERFRQGDDSTTRKYGGTGLGLAISKRLVELMGGRIWLESEPDLGSTFMFSLPLIIPNSVKPIGTIVNRQPISENFTGKTVLIAEDEDLNFLFFQEILSATQATVIRAHNGQEAIDMVKRDESISLVLMDIQMPVLNGYAATQEILKFRKKLPVIAQTAYVMAEDRAKGFRAGFSDYVSKPIKPEELIRVLKKHLGNGQGIAETHPHTV